MRVKTVKMFVHRGQLIELGTVFAVPGEVDERTASGWIIAGIAEAVPEWRVAKPVENRVKKPAKNRAKKSKKA